MRPRLLDLFCGAGGAARGYRQAGFYVVGIDIKPQPRYAGDEFYQADALEYVAAHGIEFDVIHASPPCQRYSNLTPPAYRANHPDLIGATRKMLRATGKPFVIENVQNARVLLENPVMLCGSMFGLKVWRHRYFELWPRPFILTYSCNHSFVPVCVSGSPRRGGDRTEPSTQARREAMETPWMNRLEMDEAIPPAYTHYIGAQLLRALEAA